jgi:hypothetical protein
MQSNARFDPRMLERVVAGLMTTVASNRAKHFRVRGKSILGETRFGFDSIRFFDSFIQSIAPEVHDMGSSQSKAFSSHKFLLS